ncbi:hypothetical protein [Streptomyces beijiangensis]|uniref:Uncharacterized protein n=1 Tax=Streptomyces beijiangensis TaxID=163361 RepID=A0A939JE12_9ACTN|nr:hypothetical protein [Streptomyces beijiangensis]MBO0512596.1 hypothetical protein [Streptomyces beijiangensis]
MERRRALKYGAVLAGLLLAGVSAGPASPAGFALDSECGFGVGMQRLRTGAEFWPSLNQLTNHSDSPIEITGVTAVHVPQGIRVTGWSAYDAMPDGQAMSGDAAVMRPYTNLAARPIRIPARTATTVYPMVHLQLTRPGTYMLKDFRIDYIKDGHRYTQAVACSAELASGPFVS